MAVVTLKSAAITSLDASPPVRTTAGQGMGARLMSVDGYVTVGGTDSTDSIYRCVRVPSNAIIKNIQAESHGTITTLTADVGPYYSSEAFDQTGSSVANSGVVNSGRAFFASAITNATADVPKEATNESGSYDVTKRQQPLWQAAGLTTDPGGNFDIAFTLTAGASITGTVTLGMRVEYTQPYI